MTCNIYSDDIYDYNDNICGRINGNFVNIYSITFEIKKSKHKRDGWLCFKIYNSNWRLNCKIYSNEMEFSIRDTNVFTPIDLKIFSLVVNHGSVFLYNKIFVPQFSF
jgi:hypothetical protein